MNPLSFHQALILLVLTEVQEDRSCMAVFHIIKGKKSSQTIQDIKWYELAHFYSSSPFLSETEFHKNLQSLQAAGFIKLKGKSAFLTGKGEAAARAWMNFHPAIDHFNGWKFGTSAAPFWNRLTLLIQSLSQMLAQERAFLPATGDFEAKQWVKRYWPSEKTSQLQLGRQLYKEMFEVLQQLPETTAKIMTRRLSGRNHFGRTFLQLADEMQREKDELYYEFFAAVHFCISQCQLHPSTFPILSDVASPLVQYKPFTISALKTLNYLNQHMSLKDISVIRRLKQSTIEDHFVEIASEDTSFPIDSYVSKTRQKEIMDAASTLQTHRLKNIKEYVSADTDYFSIRLTLAYFGRKYGLSSDRAL
ncbi:helix-turn-helix domain-containing protein [Alteribacillus sp. HJP-4]|uniref:helix-turn-helix domain-containing protein n=1 Tax=Alteribacillus sp. HJP-4 TaxID=2775394 RepID=UPI0035CD1146